MKRDLLIWFLLLCITGFSLPVKGQQTNALPQLGKSPVKEVIAAMTLEEKASIVAGCGFNIPPGLLKTLGEDMKKMVPQPGSMASKTKNPIAPAAGYTLEIPRLGIPAIVVNDGPAGLRMIGGFGGPSYKCTAFPIGTLLASTWNKDLVFKTGKAMGNDVLEYGLDVLLAPGMNIQRNPLCGRNFEYYSEDPLVSGNIAAAMVNGIQSRGVGVSVKHFVANNQETNRESVNTIVSERALREIYLKGFEIAIEKSNPWTVMSSYNLVNGLYTSENPDLLTKVLRNDWHYKGLVMSDWNAGHDYVAQMKAGNALLMPGPYQVNTIMQAVKDGRLDEKVLDKNIQDILNLIVKTPRFKKYQYSNKPDTEENAQASRMAATEGMVLLKNENGTLPLAGNNKNIALFGNASYDTYIGGSGSGYVLTAYKIQITDGLTGAGFAIDSSLKILYQNYTKTNEPKQTDMLAAMMGAKKKAPEMPVDALLAEKMAKQSNIAFITIGRNSGEGSDRKIDNDFNLTDTEIKNIKLISEAFHAKAKKVVVLLNIGGVIETASWRNYPDAILLTWQPGLEAGNAIADLISGKNNPSGKLAVTFPVAYADVPSSKNFPGEEVINDSIIKRKVVYEEGIYVGYRYYKAFNIKPAYEFGYGLSYSQFTYSNLKLSSSTFNNKITTTITITNQGKYAGKEVMQLYVSAPSKNIDKPVNELRAFAKTKLLKKGESQTLVFTLTVNDLASFYTDKEAWIADAGNYTIKIGASSEDIKLTKTFSLAKDIVVKKVNKALAPQITINELKK
ncbi:MAG: glycoside hydrolase family 3 C-terminal domain-containing protein [Chitinophagaceae bacterium]|nr:glycoside hydrolase family 3 C-terminal domain-containing protein [Chitinophagaceae bacterium]